jgi:serine/threonine protein kinase
MAPEQFAGEAGPATDIYGLGVLAVALLSWRKPSTMMTYDRGFQWREHVELDAGPRALLGRMLQPDPGKRIADAAELRELVRKVRAGQRVVVDTPPGRPRRSRKPRGPLLKSAVAVALAVALALAIGGVVGVRALFGPTVDVVVGGPSLDDIRNRSLDLHKSMQILDQLDKRELLALQQWMYLANLQMASGAWPSRRVNPPSVTTSTPGTATCAARRTSGRCSGPTAGGRPRPLSAGSITTTGGS